MTEFGCPRCDRAFETRRGLGVHHSWAHGERLPNRECGHCGERFYSDYAKVYCSGTCHEDAVTFAGEDNPNYRGAKETTGCNCCGESFEYYPSEKEGVYCPRCVEEVDWQDPPSPGIGPEHPWWRGGKQELECNVCGETFERYPGEIEGEITLCSDECRGEWLSEAFTGAGHPNWRGGGNESYGKGWNEARREALERDDYRCVVCGATKAEMGRNPDVHHIVPVRAFSESDRHGVEDAHYLDNVVSLCISCHRKAEFGNISRTRLRLLVDEGGRL